MTINGDQVKTPYELCPGCKPGKPDLSRLHPFDCRVYVEPPRPRRPVKSEIDACTSIFLGYAQTLKNLLQFDLDSNDVKSAQHSRYDKARITLPILHRTLACYGLPSDVKPFPLKPHFLNLWISISLRIPFRISALCPCPSSVKIRTLDLLSPSALIASVHS
jgi:hypothetical protein